MNYYQITVNSEQASLIARALDFWGRCHSGQLDQLRWINYKADSDEEIESLRRVLFPDYHYGESKLNFKYGKEAFNLRKTIEHAVSWTERPLKEGEFQTVNYDGPLEGWWETEPAQVLALKNGEYKRIKAKTIYFLAHELTEVLGTSDIEEAVEIIKDLKQKACKPD